ncbi:MAG: oxygenase MpaB family protein [Acidobacteriota bacterium]
MTTTANPKWSDDAFLDHLMGSTDDLANATVAELKLDGDLATTNRILAGLRTGDQPLPDDAPTPFVRFVEECAAEAQALDFDARRAAHGAEVFRRWAYPACIVMLASSLPNGYAAPCLSNILTISDNLAVHPYRRLLGVLQLLVNVSCPGDDDHEDARTSALKLRLLHGGVRALVPEHRPQFEERFGLPVNHEDMLATIMGFSLLVVDGIEVLGFELEDDDAEDFYYLWSLFTRRMAIAPADDPTSLEFVPENLTDARAFYDSYTRRHFCDDPAHNPDGVLLTQRNRQMMIDLIPKPLRWLGLGRIPDIAMTELLGPTGMSRVGLNQTAGHHVDKALFHFLLGFGQKAEGLAEDFYTRFSMLILQDMIDHGMGHVTFSVPGSVEALRKLVVPERGGSS